jgi:hypothetical protein
MQNDKDTSEKERYEEYEDAVFRLAMHMLAEKEGKLYLEEMEALKNIPEYIPSPEAQKKFLELLDRYLKT